MKITVLDGYTLNPGDLSWDGLNKLGDVAIYERTPREKIVERCRDADIILTNKTHLDEATLRKLPALKIISVLATGYNIVDTKVAKQQGVIVSNVPGYSTPSVVQLTFALLLELTHRVQRHSDAVLEGKWASSPDFCFWNYPLVELAGKTMGMSVTGTSRTRPDQSGRHNFRWVELSELLQQSDVISIHCPLVPETQGIINKENLAQMKPSAFLLNTSRGPIVVDQDLADALNGDVISGAGIDVLSVEPPAAGNPLFKAKNCIITPHIAWATKEARARLMQITINNLHAFIAGKPQHVVN